jgi:hypothetical protein
MRNFEQVHLFILTKNRSKKLLKTLSDNREWQSSIPTTLIDDSTQSIELHDNRLICTKFGVNYHGPSDQRNLIDSVPHCHSSGFVYQLGRAGWTLPQARNYALLLGARLHIKLLMMMDDDLLLEPSFATQLSKNAPCLLRKYLVHSGAIGCEIIDMVDDSIIGHLTRRARLSVDLPMLLTPRFDSGGLLLAASDDTRFFFPNIYNEDWIWLFLENHAKRPESRFTVLQQHSNALGNAMEKVRMQEPGEVAWLGLSASGASPKPLSDLSFWKGIVEERIKALIELRECLIKKEATEKLAGIVIEALKTSRYIGAQFYATFFDDYYKKLSAWGELKNSFVSL